MLIWYLRFSLVVDQSIEMDLIDTDIDFSSSDADMHAEKQDNNQGKSWLRWMTRVTEENWTACTVRGQTFYSS